MAPDPSQPQEAVGSPLAAAIFASLLRLIRRGAERPPVLAINGPVGAGKTTLSRALRDLAAARGLRLAVASIDDLYLPLAQRRLRLAGNPFGVSRVPPGSHDLPLLRERLEAWRAGEPLRLPRFDKSLAGGEGDRAGEQVLEAEALVLEGWLMGCRSLGEERLQALLPSALRGWPLSEQERLWLPHWDRELSAYEPLWAACDGLWLLRPERWWLPRRWRFQAEARQRRAGGGSLDPEALERLVRASLHSLPPPLYIDPLWNPCVDAHGDPHSSCGSAAGIEAGGMATPNSDAVAARSRESGVKDSLDRSAAAIQANSRLSQTGGGRSGHVLERPTHERYTMGGPGGEDSIVASSGVGSLAAIDSLPLLGVAVLDGRRRLINEGAQSSLSSLSSAIG